jgi:hypothetical protein
MPNNQFLVIKGKGGQTKEKKGKLGGPKLHNSTWGAKIAQL